MMGKALSGKHSCMLTDSNADASTMSFVSISDVSKKKKAWWLVDSNNFPF